MKIGNFNIDNNLFLAPMAGVTDVGFRHLAKKYGAGLTYTEMASAAALAHGSKKTNKLLLTSPLEEIKAVQVFGNSEADMVSALSHFEGFDIIDINMGCPAPKIVKNGEGSALMKNPALAAKIITAVVRATEKPVTVKIRKGFGKNTCLEFARMCEECGVSALTIHGRTREDMYSGKVDLEAVASVKAALKIPVIGNGDVRDEASLKEMQSTGVDAVMIGRGALGRPFIFNQLLGKGVPNVFDVATEHVSILRQYFTEAFLSKYLRKHFLWYTYGMQIDKDVKLSLANMQSVNQGLDLLKNIFK